MSDSPLKGRDLTDLTHIEKEVLRRRVGLAISTGLSRDEVALRLHLAPDDVIALLKTKTAREALEKAHRIEDALVLASNAVTTQTFIDDARKNLNTLQHVRDTALPMTIEARDAAAVDGIPLNPGLAKSTAIELLALAGHTKVHKSEEVHRLEISPKDASVLSAALTEARLHRDSSIIDITPIHTPLDTRD